MKAAASDNEPATNIRGIIETMTGFAARSRVVHFVYHPSTARLENDWCIAALQGSSANRMANLESKMIGVFQ
jgi:hypothetical protein